MRRITIAIAALALTLACVIAPAASANAAPAAPAAQAAVTPAFTEQGMKDLLAAFIGDGTKENNRADRTSFGSGEKAAADWLVAELQGYGYDNAKPTAFQYGEDYASQNVDALYASSPDNKTQIIVSANYDNLYGKVGNIQGNKGAGAMQNGTGVAVVLALAEKLKAESPALPFNVRFVLFGASEVGLIGSQKYLADQMTGDERENTALVVSLRRIGGDHTYLYTDEVDTEHGDLFLKTAAENGLSSVRAQPRSIPYITTEYVQGLPYANWGMIGDHARFMSRKMNILSVYGGNVETLNLNDIDGKAGTITYTENDTLAGLENKFPDYGVKMAETAELLYRSLIRDDFLTTVLNSASARYNYAWLTKPYVVTLIVIGVLILAGVGLIFIVKRFEKKYPLKPLVRNLKIAVFGMEYETPTEENIYVDVKPNNKPDPFS